MSQISYLRKIVVEQRNQKGISQAELADLTGISKSTIEKFESGKHSNLTLDNLLLIFKVLDLTTIPLIQPVTQEEERNKLLNDIIGYLASCDTETLRLYHYTNENLVELIKHITAFPRE